MFQTSIGFPFEPINTCVKFESTVTNSFAFQILCSSEVVEVSRYHSLVVPIHTTTNAHIDYGAKETVDVTDKTEDEVAKDFEYLVDKGKLMRRSGESEPHKWASVAEL